MADWATVAIALISASAGFGGNALQNWVTWKSQAKKQISDDAAQVRQKLEEFFLLIDELESGAAKTYENCTKFLIDPDGIEKSKPINLGKIRSFVHLYFPSCEKPLRDHDERGGARIKAFRDAKKREPQHFAIALMEYADSLYQLSAELRGCAIPIASKAGETVRKALSV